MVIDHVKHTCKIGQGSKCCKYLLAGVNGFECGKYSPEWKKIIDTNWNSTRTAQGDNCEGQPFEILNTKEIISNERK